MGLCDPTEPHIATLGYRTQLEEHFGSSNCWAGDSGPLLRSSGAAFTASRELDSISLSPMISAGPSLELLAFHGHIALTVFDEELSMENGVSQTCWLVALRLSKPPFLLCKMERKGGRGTLSGKL